MPLSFTHTVPLSFTTNLPSRRPSVVCFPMKEKEAENTASCESHERKGCCTLLPFRKMLENTSCTEEEWKVFSRKELAYIWVYWILRCVLCLCLLHSSHSSFLSVNPGMYHFFSISNIVRIKCIEHLRSFGSLEKIHHFYQELTGDWIVFHYYALWATIGFSTLEQPLASPSLTVFWISIITHPR
jgi:hypothetical protein